MRNALLVLMMATLMAAAIQPASGDQNEDYAMALDLREEGQYEEALASIDMALSEDDMDIDSLELKGDILVELGQLDEALDVYYDILDIDPDLLDVRQKACLIHYEMGDYLEAHECCEENLEIDPAYSDSLTLQADCRLKASRRGGGTWDVPAGWGGNDTLASEILEIYDRATIANPNDTSAWNNRGVLLGKVSRYGESIVSFNEAIGINSSFAPAWNNRGVSKDKLGDHEGSIADYRNATALDPLLAEAWHNLCYTIQLQAESYEDLQEAQGYCDNASRMDPELADEFLGLVYVMA
ncbi:MAG: tetratricopeptide repeat protein [Methanotrichaceae archaeon]|nr:tetratricopeptide repeat protein [Methanotrichaceae archaeon]